MSQVRGFTMHLTECKGLIRLYWSQLKKLFTLDVFWTVGIFLYCFLIPHWSLVGAVNYFKSHSRVFASLHTLAAVVYFLDILNRDTGWFRALLVDTWYDRVLVHWDQVVVFYVAIQSIETGSTYYLNSNRAVCYEKNHIRIACTCKNRI